MHVIFVSEFYNTRVGGAEIVLHRLVDEVQARGHKVTVVSFEKHHGNGQLSESSWNFEPHTRLDISLEAMRSASRLSGDVVFSQHYYHFSSVFAAKVAKELNIPFVLKPIGIYENRGYIGNTLLDLNDMIFGQGVLKKATIILPTSQFEADRLSVIKGVANKIKVIHSGVEPVQDVVYADVEQFRRDWKLKSTDHIILSVGRVELSKGSDLLIQAIQDISPPWRLLMVGQMDRTFGLRYKDHYVTDKVIFTGQLSAKDLACAYFCADIFVNASGTELLSLSIREAQSMGIGIIASDVGGNPELVKDGVNGRLFKAGDWRDLQRKIQMEPLNGPSLVQQSMQNYLDETIQVLEDAANHKLSVEIRKSDKTA